MDEIGGFLNVLPQTPRVTKPPMAIDLAKCNPRSSQNCSPEAAKLRSAGRTGYDDEDSGDMAIHYLGRGERYTNEGERSWECWVKASLSWFP